MVQQAIQPTLALSEVLENWNVLSAALRESTRARCSQLTPWQEMQ